jgi:hypothetical protein
MQRSVGILGTGWVGASVAISVLHAGVASELLLSDMRAEVAEGEAMDLAHGASFYPTAAVRAVPREALLETGALVIAAGRGGKPGESRLDLLRDNARILREVGASLRGYEGIVIVVTNPVDVLTWVVADASGLPPERVIGTGTMLDTARLRQSLGDELRLDPHSIHASVVGEHGDSEVVLWSTAHVGGTPLRRWTGWSRERERPIARAPDRRAGADGGVRDHPPEGRDEPRDRARDRRAAAHGASRGAASADGVAHAGGRAGARGRGALAADDGGRGRRGAGDRAGDGRHGARGADALGRGAEEGDRVDLLKRGERSSSGFAGIVGDRSYTGKLPVPRHSGPGGGRELSRAGCDHRRCSRPCRARMSMHAGRMPTHYVARAGPGGRHSSRFLAEHRQPRPFAPA